MSTLGTQKEPCNIRLVNHMINTTLCGAGQLPEDKTLLCPHAFYSDTNNGGLN